MKWNATFLLSAYFWGGVVGANCHDLSLWWAIPFGIIAGMILCFSQSHFKNSIREATLDGCLQTIIEMKKRSMSHG